MKRSYAKQKKTIVETANKEGWSVNFFNTTPYETCVEFSIPILKGETFSFVHAYDKPDDIWAIVKREAECFDLDYYVSSRFDEGCDVNSSKERYSIRELLNTYEEVKEKISHLYGLLLIEEINAQDAEKNNQ